jgi:hypothetical protein
MLNVCFPAISPPRVLAFRKIIASAWLIVGQV